MKEKYLQPVTIVIRVTVRSFCSSTHLDSLEEKNDLEGLEWNYN